MKKVLSILLAFVMLFSLVGCGEDSDTTDGENSGANSDQETEPVKKVNVRYKTEYPHLAFGSENYEVKDVTYLTEEGKIYYQDKNDPRKELADSAKTFSFVGGYGVPDSMPIVKSDNTVKYDTYDEKNGGYGPVGVTVDWKDIISVEYFYGSRDDGGSHLIGIKSDGTVVTCGQDLYGETKVSEWTDIVAIKAFRGISVGIKADGSVVSAGDDYLIDTYLKDVKLKVD